MLYKFRKYRRYSSKGGGHHHFYREGKQIIGIYNALVFKDYIRLFFETGETSVWRQSEIEVRKSSLTDRLSHNTLKYCAEVANVVSVRITDGTGLLAKQYEKLQFVDKKSVLATYLNPDKHPIKITKEKLFIVPFGCNSSQKLAVQNALTDSISIIKGPPGTGKTQTILNIIANILMEGKRVAVVSNNNAATQNVLEKLQKYGLQELVASLGSKENKQVFIAAQTQERRDYPTMDDSARGKAMERVAHLHTLLAEMLEKRNELATLKTLMDQVLLEKEHFDQYYQETFREATPVKLKKDIKAAQLLKVWCMLEENPINFFQKAWLVYVVRVGSWRFYRGRQDEVVAILQKVYYELKVEELQEQYKTINKHLERFHFETLQKELTDLSLALMYDVVGKRYNHEIKMQFTERNLRSNATLFNHTYPIILSTTHSIRESLGGAHMYDYMIVDEASQVDLATGVLAMACTQRLIVVGDEKQLPNVVTPQHKARILQIGADYALGKGYQYEAYSLLTSLMERLPTCKRVLLKEHYRCHPKIIQFCNQKFYHNELVIMTEDKGEEDVLKVYQTVAGNHARGHFNQRQLDEITDYVLPELDRKAVDTELGIITPYKEQKSKMADAIGREEIAIDTVHKFQGREKEDIVIATVDNEITAFVDDPNLLNVAVSRAKKRLRLVVSEKEKDRQSNVADLMRYMAYNNGEVLEGRVYSVFDLLYKDYEKQRQAFLKGKKQVSSEISENLIYGLIQEILISDEFCDLDSVVHQPLRMLIKDMKQLDDHEIAYVMNRKTHTDFVIFRRVDRSPVLVVEVDGYAYHKEGTIQFKRDQLKDQILTKYRIPFIRLKTNESNEKERLEALLREVRQSAHF